MQLTIKYSFIFLLFFSTYSFGQEITTKQEKHIKKFINAVEKHSVKKVVRLTDKTYRTEQILFLEGNKKQFVSELFGGNIVDTKTYHNTDFYTIAKMEVISVKHIEKDRYAYTFIVQENKNSILVDLLLVKIKGKYGFVGAVG